MNQPGNATPAPAMGQEENRQEPKMKLSTVNQIAAYNAQCGQLFADLVMNPRRPLSVVVSADDAYDMAREHAYFGEDE